MKVLKFLRRHLLKRPTHATVVAYVALFFAMSGTAYAAVQWTGANIADGSLTGADVQDGSLTGTDVAPDSITGDNIAPGSISGSDLAPGTVSTGDAGGAGTVHVTDIVQWIRGDVDVDNNQTAQPYPIGPSIGSIPGVGDLFVAACDGSNRSAQIGFRNTSGGTVYGLYGEEKMYYNTAEHTGYEGTEHDGVLPAGMEIGFENSGQGVAATYFVLSGDQANPHITRLTVSTQLYGIDGCILTAKWD